MVYLIQLELILAHKYSFLLIIIQFNPVTSTQVKINKNHFFQVDNLILCKKCYLRNIVVINVLKHFKIPISAQEKIAKVTLTSSLDE